MNSSDAVMGLVRQILTFVGGFAVAKGWLDMDTLTQIVGALIALGSAAWVIATKRQTAVLQAAAKFDNVTKIVVSDKATATAVPSPKVDTK